MNMPNGDPYFELTDLPALERFFAPIASDLEAFAARHRLLLLKYEKQGHSWNFRFQHPAGGVAVLQVLKSDEDTVRIVAHWAIHDLDNYSRRTLSTTADVRPRDDPQLIPSLFEFLNRVLALTPDDAVPDGIDYRGKWWPENFDALREWERSLPLPAL